MSKLRSILASEGLLPKTAVKAPAKGDRIKFDADKKQYPSPLTGKVVGGGAAKGFDVLVQFAGGGGEKTFKVKQDKITRVY